MPSMKQDYRIHMHFLPHILLHSLLEGTCSDKQKAFDEIMAVINSYNAKRELDPKILYVNKVFYFSFFCIH